MKKRKGTAGDITWNDLTAPTTSTGETTVELSTIAVDPVPRPPAAAHL